MKLLLRHLPRSSRSAELVKIACSTSKHPLRNFKTSAHLAQSPAKAPIFTPADGSQKPFFVTTPIFYVNASPHIGHLHSLVLTDVLARYSKLRSPERRVIFTTGTDEHGLKIQQAAKAQGVGEEEFCAGVSERFKNLADLADVEYTDFIRTSEERHYKAVEHFWAKLVESGDIYKGTHGGWYSVSDECFYSAQQVTKADDGKMVAAETGNEVVWEEEENWKFRLPKYRDALVEWAQQAESIHPPTMRSFILSQAEDMADLSISRPRSRVKWGVPVPGDAEQTIYVWVDALINYITVLGYPQSTDGWPADVHVVGKDIIRFHAMHWPSLLMAANMQPPTRVLAHAHWTMGKFKMSKSRGNVVDPITAIGVFGADAVRWYLMRAGGTLADDSDYSDEQLRSNYSILASQIGNLVARMSSPRILAQVTKFKQHEKKDPLDTMLRGVRDAVDGKMEAWEVTKACEQVMDVVSEANKVFTQLEPWRRGDSTAAILYAHSALRIAAILLQPIMPVKAAELLDRLGIPESERRWEDAAWSGAGNVDVAKLVAGLMEAGEKYKDKTHVFPRIEKVE